MPPRFAFVLLMVVTVAAMPAGAQGGLDDVLGDIGRSTAAEEEVGPQPGQGTVLGRVFDGATGSPLERVTVILKWPDPGTGETPRQEIRISDVDGGFEFPSVPPGRYDINFIKAGYRNSTMKEFAVFADSINRADFPLPPLAAGASDEVLDLEEFVVEAETAAAMMTTLETRMDSDQMLNVLSAEDFSKYAAGDVAEVLQRVAGINIVEGQFAVIRGLEDRYSSTLYNGGIVPSPDPDRQSVQLDLFPSDVVSNLEVAKAFSPELPSNSSGGSINIVTHDYPEEFEVKLKAGTGFNDNAKERFISTQGATNLDRVFEVLDGAPIDPKNPNPVAGLNPVGRESENSGSGNWFDELTDVIESDFVASMGGRREWGDREFRLKMVVGREEDYATAFGFQQGLEPVLPDIQPPQLVFDPSCFCFVTIPERVVGAGGLAFGELDLTDGVFDLTVSEYERRTTGYGAFGFDLDDAGNHKVDASVFYSRVEQEIVRVRENGYLPTFDYATATELQLANNLPNRPGSDLFIDDVTLGSFIGRSMRAAANGAPDDGTLVFSSFLDSTSFDRDRDLLLYQINGDHTFDELPGLHFSWLTNWATTNQTDQVSGLRFFFEPCGYSAAIPCPPGVGPVTPPTEFPVDIDELGPGLYGANNRILFSGNVVEENSRFSRVDADYEIELSESSRFTIAGGMWWEEAARDVEAFYLETPTVSLAGNPDCFGITTQYACTSDTPSNLGRTVFDNLGLTSARTSTTEGSRDIKAWHLRGKWEFWERLDLLGGARYEDILIESLNDPFVRDPVTGEVRQLLGGPQTFPSRYLFFDRLDNPYFRIQNGQAVQEVGSAPDDDITYNDQILGIDGINPAVPCLGAPEGDDLACVDFPTPDSLLPFLNGEIDEKRLLPSAGFNFRPIEGMSIRGSWSKSVARPSFRELGFYVTVEPGSDDLILGNPQLQLSDVESWDGRVEYNWGAFGDLVAASYFDKTIQRPIESILIGNPNDASVTGATVFRTFFNNPNTADLRGYEVELRKSFDFLTSWWNAPEAFQYFSIGGNYTYIDAEVARTEEEIRRADVFFLTPEAEPGMDPVPPLFTELESRRRLFNQPEWIANADLTFDHPDWGTRITVAWFAISDVLDAASSSRLVGSDVIGMTLDRYVDGFDEWRVTFSQTFTLPKSYGQITFKFAGKNLSDSPRRIIYDTNQTAETFTEREFQVGRDYDLSVTWSRSF